MNGFHTILILLAAALAVYTQAAFDMTRLWLGAQVDLLPSLVVYTSLSCNLPTVAVLAVCGGMMFDSLSANPLGVSILPLFLIGFIIQQYRSLILRDQTYAQFVLGLGASASAPIATLLILINLDSTPLIGWFSLWQWVVVSAFGAAATPLWFWLFGRALNALTYRPFSEAAYYDNREIKRGRQKRC